MKKITQPKPTGQTLPELRFLALCRSTSENQDGSLNLIGLFAGLTLPLDLPETAQAEMACELVFSIYTTAITEVFNFRVVVEHPDGTESNFLLGDIPNPSKRMIRTTIQPLNLRLSQLGVHRVQVYLGKQVIGQYALMVSYMQSGGQSRSGH